MKTAACKAVAKLAINLKAIADSHLANFSRKRQLFRLWNSDNLLIDNQEKISIS